MADSTGKNSGIREAAKDLFDYAVDREDVKWLMAHLSEEALINRHTVDHELQILKIVSVGWGISYYLENSSQKSKLSALYWNSVNEFSKEISTATEYMTGHDIDYFEVLKKRLDMYVTAMTKGAETIEPASVVGPEFARTCGNADDIFTFMTGSKMFINTITRVKQYLEAIKLR
jgi:hypothetical protein